MKTQAALQQRRARLVRSLADLAQVIRGSLIRRVRRCGRATCHCASGPGHAVVCIGTTLAGGKNVQVTVPAELVPVAETWTENYRHLWEVIEEISAINRELLQRRLVQAPSQAVVAGKRARGSARRANR